jgi:hypothetical protein
MARRERIQPVSLGVPNTSTSSIKDGYSRPRTIGWDNAIKGYFSVEWRYLAETSLYENTTDNQDGKDLSILRGMQLAFHTLSQQLWKARNQVLHRSHKMALRNIHDTEVAEICELHSRRDKFKQETGIIVNDL